MSTIKTQAKAMGMRVPLLLIFVCALSCALYYRAGSKRITWPEAEEQAAIVFFRDSIKLSKVRLHNAGWDEYNGGTFTVNNDIFFRTPIKYEDRPAFFRSTLIHELVHVWQHQQRAAYTKEEGYFYTLSPERPLSEYGSEQQAQLLTGYYSALYLQDFTFERCNDCPTLGREKALAIYHRLHREMLTTVRSIEDQNHVESMEINQPKN